MPVEEHQLTTFEVAALPPGPWLVFAPHGDDETFGMGGSLIKAHEAGLDTHIIVLTDGALGGDREDLVAVRREEVEQAGAILGLTSLTFWDEPDRQLGTGPELVSRVSEAIIAAGAASVFFPGPLELHPDHRAAGLLVWSALGQARQRQNGQGPAAISYEIGVQNPINTLIDISNQVALKEKAMAVYASQNSQNNYPELVLSLNKGRTFTLPASVTFAEGYYRYSETELTHSFQEATRRIIDLYFA